MKVLYAHITQNLGGVEKRFFTYFKYILNQYDNEYTVLISRAFLRTIGDNLYPKYSNRVIHYGFAWNKKNKLTRYIDYLYLGIVLALMRVKSFDVVHFNTSGARMFRNWLRSKAKFISAVTSPKDWLEREISSLRFGEMMSKGFGVDCLDSNIHATIEQRFPENKINLFEAPCSFISKSLTNVCASGKEHAICFVGRLIPEKGADLLYEALPDIIRGTSFKVYILGNGSLKSKFSEMISANGWEERVILTYDPQPVKYMAKSKIFLSLQRDENYPSQSLLEAMSCDNVIIATNVGLTYKLVTNANGALISDSKELVDAISKLECDNSLSEMGRHSRQLTGNHTVEKFHKYLLHSYATMLNNIDK